MGLDIFSLFVAAVCADFGMEELWHDGSTKMLGSYFRCLHYMYCLSQVLGKNGSIDIDIGQFSGPFTCSLAAHHPCLGKCWFFYTMDCTGPHVISWLQVVR